MNQLSGCGHGAADAPKTKAAELGREGNAGRKVVKISQKSGRSTGAADDERDQILAKATQLALKVRAGLRISKTRVHRNQQEISSRAEAGTAGRK